jgi:nucleotide-binding universal stress UspA family protein
LTIIGDGRKKLFYLECIVKRDNMYKKMVLCITEATPEEVVRAAVKLCEKNTQVYLLHIVRNLSDFVRENASKEFSWATNLFKKAKVKSKLELVESANIKSAIISFAKKNSCDVIVTGTIPRKGLAGYLSESVSDYLVKNAPCTVILIRGAGQPV